MDKIKDLELELKIIDIVIEYLSAQLTKWRAKKKNKREELKVCRLSVKQVSKD